MPQRDRNGRTGRIGTYLGVGLLTTWVVVLGWITLAPARRAAGSGLVQLCLICGDRGTADALLNVLLFVPLGLFLGRLGRGALHAALLGVLLSWLIEAVQLFVPGRYPTLGDVAWNGVGAALGTVLYGLVRLHLHGKAAGPRWLSAGVATALGLAILAGGLLLEPHRTPEPYWAQWTPEVGLPRYRGQVLDARLNEGPFPNTWFPDQRNAREELSGDWELEATLRKGRRPRRISPILIVLDEAHREIVLLGVQREDLILRERTFADRLKMDHPDIRLLGALSTVSQGEVVTVGVRREGAETCAWVGDTETCGLAPTPGRAWSLLMYPEGTNEPLRRMMDVACMFVLFLAVGFLSPTWRSALGSGLLLTGLVVGATLLTRFAPASAAEGLGGGAGLLVGRWSYVAARAIGRKRPEP